LFYFAALTTEEQRQCRWIYIYFTIGFCRNALVSLRAVLLRLQCDRNHRKNNNKKQIVKIRLFLGAEQFESFFVQKHARKIK